MSLELSWSHYNTLARVEDPVARQWYAREAIGQNWSVRALERQIGMLYYERLLSSKDNGPVITEAAEQTRKLTEAPKDFLRDPYILDFLDIHPQQVFSESELETAIVARLRDFLMELGKGFSFVGRQVRISTETSHFQVDLVFYNYLLKCFVLIDLKTKKLSHADIGQMDMYVRMFDDLKRGEDDNPTLGIILCSDKDETLVRYSVLNDSKQLFASKYRLLLPSEAELKAELERRQILRPHP